ncbi:ABC transporter ATP-binding protein [Ramlibacter sp. WS9]|uniref:ABC transporter ATP-binding protein n=1 Tax=Ramlibacter sp. WS9 TaxID=1882741 RepID=UPI0011425797|nr:ABC transporter ATP-binding protein [Ramlibacter sp. WS9]ROZ78095.1 ABC transporter ATP-binding protein [Ramlibacter sp. WS9]HSV36683.1 ABC transporter ATP-binding protein [Ramlibacter sp.]
MVLVVDGLCKAYGEVVVADDVSFSLAHGECLGVIGPNGAGKSTLFHLLAGAVTPERGSIRLNGNELVGLPAHRRARMGVARAFQIPQPFAHLTVYENVLAAASFGAGLRGRAAADAAVAALERTGLHDRRSMLAGALPLLDRKRLEVAKGIAAAPKLLLLDEVAGGLTEREVQAMVELVRELKQSYAVIWIEHIPHALKAVADRVMVLHFGRKLLEDTPQAVMDSAIVREIYMGIPADAAA